MLAPPPARAALMDRAAEVIRDEMNSIEQINGAEKLTAVFGCWPTFHDAEVVWIRLDRGGTDLGPSPTLEALVHAFEMTDQVDAAGFYLLRNHVLAHLRFSSVGALKLDDFNQQNVLWGLTISNLDSSGAEAVFQVEFEPSWGVGVTFQCKAIAVVSVQLCDKEGKAQTD